MLTYTHGDSFSNFCSVVNGRSPHMYRVAKEIIVSNSSRAPIRCPRLKLLLVGKANVGKTTIFKSLKSSKKQVGIGTLLKRDGNALPC